MTHDGPSSAEQRFWQMVLVTGPPPELRRRQWLFRLLPHGPRCKFCFAPFAGIGAKLLLVSDRNPSRKNPRFCASCFEKAPMGGIETEVGVLFADVRGYTPLAESKSPQSVTAVLNRYYNTASDVLLERQAIIDKLAGDEVMALFLPGIVGEELIEQMVSSAEALLRAVGYGSPAGAWLQIGIGLAFGTSFVGNVGGEDIKDFTAIGDVVNTASRLTGAAQPGQVMMPEHIYERVRERYPDAPSTSLELKGKSEPVTARIVELG